MTMTRALRISMRDKILSADQDLMESAGAELERMIKTLSEQYKSHTAIKYHVVRGAYFPSTLIREARRLRSGLVVMGPRGATGVTNTFLGRITNFVIEVSNFSVLAMLVKAVRKSQS